MQEGDGKAEERSTVDGRFSGISGANEAQDAGCEGPNSKSSPIKVRDCLRLIVEKLGLELLVVKKAQVH